MKRTIEKTEVSQTISLKEYLGWGANDSNIRDAFASDIIDRIIERTTKENRDVNGKLFAAYSKKYIESDSFKIWGKSADNVNMTLSGDMLSSLGFDSDDNELVISIQDKENILKAFGNITGERGHGKSKERDFFGVTDKELSALASPYRPNLSSKKETDKVSDKIIQALIANDLYDEEWLDYE